ncbi:tripartite tricarboxylate transporter substrate binding protein [Ideonella sp. A 288]|uniref:Bug family tripartite tricarboxylate transporter substrate binding protein n=1 Tax=Ideonella sp. A 288 TaxID=1962181 RepID=UPI000B4BA4B7|nr:tripartite tricarboxylate transporter substrate binding protein [Ideonella sp. A 288]
MTGSLFNRRAAIAAAALALAGALVPAQAQTFPTRPVRIVVPYAPGGATDILGRMVAAKLQEAWGQNVTVENKPGASGVVGNDLVAKAPPDGYTVLLGITAIVQGATLMKLPYDPYKDFIPVSQLSTSTSLLVVPAKAPYNTVAEYVALLKQQPGKHGYGSYGAGTSAHIQGELFKSHTGTDLAHVPYKGAAPMMTDLLGGQLSMAFVDAGTGRAHVKSGAVKALAVTGTERLKMAPDAPTFAELGYANFEPKGWFGFFLPAGTPAPIVAKLAADLQKAIRLPDVTARIEDLGQTPVGGTPEAFAAVIKTDGPVYAKLIKDLNIKLD